MILRKEYTLKKIAESMYFIMVVTTTYNDLTLITFQTNLLLVQPDWLLK